MVRPRDFQMYIVFAGNKRQFDDWAGGRSLTKHRSTKMYKYVSQGSDLHGLDAEGIDAVYFVGTWWEHPVLKSYDYTSYFLPRIREANVPEIVE